MLLLAMATRLRLVGAQGHSDPFQGRESEAVSPACLAAGLTVVFMVVYICALLGLMPPRRRRRRGAKASVPPGEQGAAEGSSDRADGEETPEDRARQQEADAFPHKIIAEASRRSPGQSAAS